MKPNPSAKDAFAPGVTAKVTHQERQPRPPQSQVMTGLVCRYQIAAPALVTDRSAAIQHLALAQGLVGYRN